MRQGDTSLRQRCPNCNAPMPVHNGFMVWCPECNWNLRPHREEPPTTVVEKAFTAASDRVGGWLNRQLLAEMSRDAALRMRWSPAYVGALALSVLAHAVTVLMAMLAVMSVARAWPSPVLLIGALFIVSFAWFLIPWLPSLGKDSKVLPREENPALYRVTDRVASSVGCPLDYTIVLESNFNAAMGEVGWRRKRILFLGLPLISVLDRREATAIVAHEFAHAIHGDPKRSLVTYTAIISLAAWTRWARPYLFILYLPFWGRTAFILLLLCFLVVVSFNRLWVDHLLVLIGSVFGVFVLMTTLAQVARGWIYLLARLMIRDMQRAEYLADRRAAHVSGTDAVLGLMHKLHYSDAFMWTVQHVGLNGRGAGLFSVLRQRLTQVPATELERIQRVERLEASRLEATHPPTAHRIELLQRQHVAQPAVEITPEEYEQMRAELARLEPEVENDVLDQYSNYIF